MHKPVPHVPGLFLPPNREDALNAISRALLRIRSYGWSCESLAQVLDCSDDTIERASNEKSMLTFDSIARLGFSFPEEFKLIETLWSGSVVEPPTPIQRLERIEREAEALRKEIGA